MKYKYLVMLSVFYIIILGGLVYVAGTLTDFSPVLLWVGRIIVGSMILAVVGISVLSILSREDL